MAGIYIHIPFCRSKCFYCGFYSVASLKLKEVYLDALCKEMMIRKDYLESSNISTLYLGGGTPSYLDVTDLELLCGCIHKLWSFDSGYEASIEMNPEDVDKDKLVALKYLGFNRLTIGIQSFNDNVLKRINRTHSASQAYKAVELANEYGFDNIGIDLIIGLPGTSFEDLEKDLYNVSILGIKHVSIYILSIDSHSVFERLLSKGKFKLQDDDVLADYYLYVSDYLKSIGYEHYEISNFAKESKYSRHNTSYWHQIPYIGLGTAAHSYNGNSRQWNVSDIKEYVEGINKGEIEAEIEVLSRKDKFNEYLMTNFRTMWGLDTHFLASEYPLWWEQISKYLCKYEDRGLLLRNGERLRLTEKGWLISDAIFSDLFV